MYIHFPEVDLHVEGMDVSIPPMLRIRQKFDNSKIEDIEKHICKELVKLNCDSMRGRRVCITAGSRGIPHMLLIYKTICAYLKEQGVIPFIIPAMGSHGGATADGQKEILAGYGLTEESLGVSILSSMETIEYGRLSCKCPLYCDKYAAEADAIIIINKVKPHTDFRAKNESGLAKMISIGISKHKGASEFHKLGFENFGKYMPEAVQQFCNAFPVLGAIGIVQNAYDDICTIEATGADGILGLDERLLIEAKRKVPRFKFKDVDLLIIDQIGKEISGYGADPNVTGRTNGFAEDFAGILRINKMFISGLSERTHHNGAGLAMADVTTRRCLNNVDWTSTWTNLITSGRIGGASIPMYMNNDYEAIRLALHTCIGADRNAFRIARVKNTLELFEVDVSPALYAELKEYEDVELLREAEPIAFDQEGFLTPF